MLAFCQVNVLNEYDDDDDDDGIKLGTRTSHFRDQGMVP